MAAIRKAFLLAAGLGTRLRPLTDRIPKCLVPVNGRPLCDYWFALCQAHGIDQILMNTHHLAQQVEQYVANLDRPLDITLFHEPQLLGSAGTVRENRDWVDGDPFLVIYSDNLSNADLSALCGFHAKHAEPVTMGLFHTSKPGQCGIAELDPDGRIVDFVEKPEDPKSDLANAGLYVCDPATLDGIPDDKAVVDYGHDVLPRYIGNMYGLRLDGYHLDVGTPESYELAQQTCPKDMPE